MLTEIAIERPPALTPKIRLEDVAYRFESERGPLLALDGVNLASRPGELLAVVGESGCGKSTLLRLIAGLLAPTCGSVELDGRRVEGISPLVSMAFQQPVLLEWRNLLENVLLPAELRRLPRQTLEPRARQLLRDLGLEGFEHRRPRALSGGMQQRAALARALLLEPQVLLLDEPFSALDAITREQLQGELSAVWSASGATALLVTHDIAEAVFLADRVALMTPRPGRVAEIVEIDLPRPRLPELRYSPDFGAYCQQVRRTLETAADAEAERGR